MNHEYLNGDAMEEILVDESIELFVMHPPYMGIDVQRYANPEKQINNVKSVKKFIKNLIKITKNCEKALKKGGSICIILPVDNIMLLPNFIKSVQKNTKLNVNATLIWSLWNENYANKNQIGQHYCHVVHLSKGPYRRDKQFMAEHNDAVFTIPMEPETLQEDYSKMGFVDDAMPVELAERLISLFSLPGDTVADVLGGTGTVSIAAENTGRNSVYNDASFVQTKIAKKRMEDLIYQKKRRK